MAHGAARSRSRAPVAQSSVERRLDGGLASVHAPMERRRGWPWYDFPRGSIRHRAVVTAAEGGLDLNQGPWFMEDVPSSSVLTCVPGATFTFEILSLAPLSSLATCETTSLLSFYNMFGVECIENSRLSQKNTLRINSVKEVGADPKMSVNVSRVKPLSDNSVVSESRISTGSCCSSKAAISLLRAYKTCWLWMFLLIVLLSSSAYSAEDTLKSEEGKCRYDLTSVAALSCMQPDGVWRPPSQTCCNALLYAIDQIPGSDEGGACCLCRYMNDKDGLSGLATSYVMCNGKDKDIISKWSMFRTKKCLAVCTTSISDDMGTSGNNFNSSSKGIWIAIAVFSVMALIICFWYFWSSKATLNASEQRRISSYEGESRAGRRRSIVPSSSLLKNVKERRFSSS